MPTNTDRSILEAALIGMEQQKKQLDEKAAEIRRILNGNQIGAIAATPEAAPRRGRRFSAGVRRRMALAQKARWAKARGESQSAAPKPKRKLSAAARAKLVANLKKARAAKAAKARPAAA